jgi:pimeloyl-ACP methyl ester carboxylesterase
MKLTESVEGFRRQGGDAAADAFEAWVRDPGVATWAEFITHCRALYSARRIVDADLAARGLANPRLAAHFFKTCESSFDFGAALARVTAPVLILGGDDDPVMPPAFQDELEAALVSAPVRRVRFANAGHFIHADAPDEYFAALRKFILDVTASS